MVDLEVFRIETLLSLGVLFVLLSVTAIIAVIISKIICFCINKKEKKFNSKHPDYVEFIDKYNSLRSETNKIIGNIYKLKIKVDDCLEKMKYYPEYSKNYQYYKSKLDVARMKIDKCKEEYDKKECEIFQLIKENKDVIESMKEDRTELYNDWVEKYKRYKTLIKRGD